MLALSLIAVGVAAVTNWSTRVRPNQRLETLSKPLTTALVMWVAIAADGPNTATALAIVGLVFCLLGDIALLDVVDHFVAGLGAFLIGPVLFIAMLIQLRLEHPWWAIPAGLALAVNATIAGRRIVAGAAAQEPRLKIPVVAYLMVILAMAVVASTTANWWAIAGAGAFVASDTILGWRAFVAEKSWMALAVMVSYHSALVGLALSLQGVS